MFSQDVSGCKTGVASLSQTSSKYFYVQKRETGRNFPLSLHDEVQPQLFYGTLQKQQLNCARLSEVILVL